MATPNAHTEVPGVPKKEPFPPFQTQTFPSQLLWLAITFVVLYVVSARFALPRIASILEMRRQRIAGDLAEAQQLKSQSGEALAAYEKSLADARSRAQAATAAMREKQNAAAEAKRKELERELSGKLAQADKAIAATKAAAMANVRSIAADAATAIVRQLIGTAPSSEAAKKAVGAAMER